MEKQNRNEKLKEIFEEIISCVESCKTIFEKEEITINDCKQIRDYLNKTNSISDELNTLYDEVESPKQQIKECAFIAEKEFSYSVTVAFKNYNSLIFDSIILYLEEYLSKKKNLN